MRTLQIINQLIETINNHPHTIYSVPWDDIILCFESELELRKTLYDEFQYQSILQMLHKTFSEINHALNNANHNELVCYLKQLYFALSLFPSVEYIDAGYHKFHFNAACLNHYKNDTIIVIGDSHVNFFSGSETLNYLPIGNDINLCPPISTPYPFTPLHLGPCLAYNCNKYNTTFRFREKAEYLIQNFIKPNASIICCLGEIDIRVHVFKQSAIQQQPFSKIVDDILSEYITFLIFLKEMGYKTYCWAPIASQKETCLVDPQFPRFGTEEERNKATEYFNSQLSVLCKRHNIGFLSIFNDMITDKYQTIDSYLSEDHCHLSQRALSLVKKEWQKINHPIFSNIVG